MKTLSIIAGILAGVFGTFLIVGYLSDIAEHDKEVAATLTAVTAAFTSADGQTAEIAAEDIIKTAGTLTFGVSSSTLLPTSIAQLHTVDADKLGSGNADLTLTEGGVWIGNPVIGRTMRVTDGSITAETSGGGFLMARSKDGETVTVSAGYGAVTVRMTGGVGSITLAAGEEAVLTPATLLKQNTVQGTVAKYGVLMDKIKTMDAQRAKAIESYVSADAWRVSQEIARVKRLSDAAAQSGLMQMVQSVVALTQEAASRLSSDVLLASLAGITENPVGSITVDEEQKPLLGAIEPLTRLIAVPGLTAEVKQQITAMAQNRSAVLTALGKTESVDSSFRNALLGKPIVAEVFAKSKVREQVLPFLLRQSIDGKHADAANLLVQTLSTGTQEEIATSISFLLSPYYPRTSEERRSAYNLGVSLVNKLTDATDQSEALTLAGSAQIATLYALVTQRTPDVTAVASWQVMTNTVVKPLWTVAADGTMAPPLAVPVAAAEAAAPTETSAVGSAGTPEVPALETPSVPAPTMPVVETPAVPVVPTPAVPEPAPVVAAPLPVVPDGRVPRSQKAQEDALKALQ